MTDDFLTPEDRCLNCGALFDRAEAINGTEGPDEGSISICIYCSHIQAYGADLKLRPLTDEEAMRLAGNKELLMAIKALERAKAAPPRLN